MPENNSAIPGLKAAMKRAGFTQTALAAELGTAVSTVARWLSGAQEPSVSTAKRLSEILACPITELLGIPAESGTSPCAVRVVKKDGKRVITIEIEDN